MAPLEDAGHEFGSMPSLDHETSCHKLIIVVRLFALCFVELTNKKSTDCCLVQAVPHLIPTTTLLGEHISVVTQISINNSSKYLNTSGAILLFQICLASETNMFGCVIVRTGRNIPQATLSVRHVRVFAQDGFCLHKNCTCHLQQYAPPEWPSDVCDPAHPVSGGLL
jgi:uncharacterized membrane protein SirB2